MINPESEEILSMPQAAESPLLTTASGKRPSAVLLSRWRNRGRLSSSGQRVCLETIRLPAGIFTSREAINRFVAALNDGESDAAATQSDSLTAAERELAAAGIG